MTTQMIEEWKEVDMSTCGTSLNADLDYAPVCIRALDGTGRHEGFHDDGHGTRWFDQDYTPAVPEVGRRFQVVVDGVPLNPDSGITTLVALNLWLGTLGEDPTRAVEIVEFADAQLPADMPAPRPTRRRMRPVAAIDLPEFADAVDGR